MKKEVTVYRPTSPGVEINTAGPQVVGPKVLSVRRPTSPSYLWLGGI